MTTISIVDNPDSTFSPIQSRSMISLVPEDRKREFRSYGLTPMAAPAAYKYFSRSDFYNTTAIYNRSLASGYGAPATRQVLTLLRFKYLRHSRQSCSSVQNLKTLFLRDIQKI